MRLFITAALLLATPAYAKETAFFTSIVSQATPNAPIIGKFPVSADAPSHLRFDYDSQGRVIQVSHFNDGDLTRNRLLGAAEVRIEYREDAEIRTYWNADGSPGTVWRICYRGLDIDAPGTVHKEVFRLDTEGRRVALELYGRNGAPPTAQLGAARYDWRWLDADTVLERRSGANDSITPPVSHYFDFALTRFSFDGRGIHWLIENVNEAGDLQEAGASGVAAVRFQYTEAGNEADMSFYDAEDRITHRRHYGAMPYGYARITYTFNNDNRAIEERYLDRENQLIDHSGGVARIVYIYDDNNAFLRSERYNAHGALVE